LLGLTLALRFQLAPAIAVILAVAVWRWRWRSAWTLAGLAAALAASGLLDLYTWGRPFSSIVSNLELNLFAGVADSFGVRPPGYYLEVLVLSSFDLAFAGAIGLYLRRRTAWPLIAVGLVMLASFSAIGHKEPRFIFPFIPIWLIGLAGLATHPGVTGLARRLVRAAPLAAAAVSLAGFAWALPMEDRIYALPILGRDDLREAYLALSRQPDLTGLIDQSGARWWRTGGYFDLHRPAPLYRLDIPATRMSLVMAEPERYASHWLLPAMAPTPPGYRPFETFGAYRVVRREHDPARTGAPAEYSTETAGSLGLAPKVTPRW
jgi:MFS family permease